MDRQIVYPGQILPETTLLQGSRDVMIALGKLAAGVLGSNTVVNGFAVTPTAPASLQVNVAPGEIYSLQNVDSTAFSTLGTDTVHQIVKQGLSLDPATLTLAAPTVSGQSINYLIQIGYQDSDSNASLLPYYNSANPAQQFAGQGNNSQAQNTVRKGVALVQAKAGTAAASGSQTTPAPDGGFAGVYVVTVAYGQTQIVAGNIAAYAGAPLIGEALPQKLGVSLANSLYGQKAAANVWSKGQSAAVASLPASSGTVMLDLSQANNWDGTLTGNITLANPSNMPVGQSGVIRISQGVTPYVIAYGSVWKGANGSLPGLTATAGAVDVFGYYVESTTRITLVVQGDVK